MNTKVFESRSAAGNLQDNPSLSQFVLKEEYDKGWSGNTPHGYNFGGCLIEIMCKLLHTNKHIQFPNGTIYWADIYETPDGDILAVRQTAGSARSIATLEFYKKKDFNFKVLLDYEDVETEW